MTDTEEPTTTPITTAMELYRRSPQFQGMIAWWVEKKQVPIGLGDFLEEMGLDAAARCARWAVDVGDRFNFLNAHGIHTGKRSIKTGLFPTQDLGHVHGHWYFFIQLTTDRHADYVPRQLTTYGMVSEHHYATAEECILQLMDHWK